MQSLILLDGRIELGIFKLLNLIGMLAQFAVVLMGLDATC